MQVAIIGGGIIGLNCAYYLLKEGFSVSLIEKGDLTDGCSFGNMGYISPSHFLPLASPGIVKQGIKWMFDSSSPFYVKPRLDLSFLKWSWLFQKSANQKTMSNNSVHLNALLQLSRALIKDMVVNDLGSDCSFTESGCFMLYKEAKTGHHEEIIAKQAEAFGLKTIHCSASEVQQYESNVKTNVLGGILYIDDCYVNPAILMQELFSYLKNKGVKFFLSQEVVGFEKQNEKVKSVITTNEKIDIDYLIVANGSWMQLTAKQLGYFVPMQPGKGYSFSYENLSNNLKYPSILVDHRVATTPYDNKLRLGGTMELSGHNDQKLTKRIQAIYNSFKLYYPEMPIEKPDENKAWFGYRPVSPDGMPYIGEVSEKSNISFAGGHAMLGVSGANATGQLIAQIVAKKDTTISIEGFSAKRFQMN